MLQNSSVNVWVRNPTPVTVQVTDRFDEQATIINEGYCEGCEAYRHTKDEVLVIHSSQKYSISGKLCVKNDGSVYVTNPGELQDGSCKSLIYTCILHVRDADSYS